MKIGILVNGMSGIGGIQRITTEKINGWIEDYGYEVILITKNQGNASVFYKLHEKCKFYNLDVKSKLYGGVISYIRNSRKGFKFYTGLKKIIETESIDILLTTVIGFDSLIVPFVKFKIPKILEIHSSGASYNMKTWFYKKYIIRQYNKIVLLSLDEIAYFGLKNVVVIPNFIYDLNENTHVNAKKNIVITAGRIAPIKQFDQLIDIWAIIAAKNLNWELHIYGGGDVKLLQEKIRKEKLEQNVRLYPATKEIKNKMQEAKIFVLVSQYEAFPMVLLEAIQAQLPIVSYDSPHGPKNIISHDIDGFIVPLNDKMAFAEKLDLLINDEVIRESFIENQKIKLDTFSKNRVMNQWNDLFLEVLRK
ncbi:glycosyltransferase involved in cell wall biosynthesis [Flavobacterium cutihirudinis]|uniref:Glycosyltransferase involved in cell wall biosynthesis n=1 Tax=Flavobacterium cutihirudinis TaxID=1265740 RepID=A0A3D9FKN3_9FLAO|nr:glycosyltransferase family 4 protein [Flavobacterium cutihirudinis]RED19562.1 glycosyltransferase involved in cell wall biosynthesis [Flavobacterium cutihirudinis]